MAVNTCSFVHRAPDRRTVEEIQKKVEGRSERHGLKRLLFSRTDKDVIAGWNTDLNKLLQVFSVC